MKPSSERYQIEECGTLSIANNLRRSVKVGERIPVTGTNEHSARAKVQGNRSPTEGVRDNRMVILWKTELQREEVTGATLSRGTKELPWEDLRPEGLIF